MININQNELNFLKLQGLQLQPAAGNSNHYACVKLFISEICVNIDFDDWGDFFTVSFAFFFFWVPRNLYFNFNIRMLPSRSPWTELPSGLTKLPFLVRLI